VGRPPADPDENAPPLRRKVHVDENLHRVIATGSSRSSDRQDA
jgi:hypothetical protein